MKDYKNQCSEWVEASGRAKWMGKGHQCKHEAIQTLDGKPYCERHYKMWWKIKTIP